MKINKKKVDHPSFTERMKKKAAKGLSLDWRFTFGKNTGCVLRYVINLEPEYVDKMVRDGILALDKEALIYLTIIMQRKSKREREREDCARREEAESERSRESFYKRGTGDQDFNEFFNNFFGGRARQRQEYYQRQEQRQERITNEYIHPAHQFDNLPEKERYGKILRLTGQVTKDTIRSQYRTLALQFHPDKLQNLDKELQDFGNEMFLQAQKAYLWMKDHYNL